MKDLSEEEKLIASLRQQLREEMQKNSALTQEIALLEKENSKLKKALNGAHSYK
jgi:hypothetical protein